MPRRYKPNVDRPDLCARAARELGLTEAKARFLEGHWMVQGVNGDGKLRLFCPTRDGGWDEITSGSPAVMEKIEQGRLF
jgi:hypothetical protein